MDYYLYTHSNDNGIFYVGKGSKDRKNDYYKSRSDVWHSVADKGYTTKVEAHGTEQDILSLEKIAIKSLVEQGVNLVNIDFNINRKNKKTGKPLSKNHTYKIKANHKGMLDQSHSNDTKAKMAYAKRRYWQKYKLTKANNFTYWSHIRSTTAFK